MKWQDLVFAFGSIIFSIALIPSLISRDKPALSTSLTTGLVLVIFSITYATLSLWFSSICQGITAALWLVLAVQKKDGRS